MLCKRWNKRIQKIFTAVLVIVLAGCFILTDAHGETINLTAERQTVIDALSDFQQSVPEIQRIHVSFHEYASVVRIPAFYDSTVDQATTLFSSLRQYRMDKLILDLRDCPGGVIKAAIALAGLVVPEGEICTVLRYRDGMLDTAPEYMKIYKSTLTEPFFKITVLTNAYTASSAELLTAAIQESGVGIVIGSRTYGKSTIQKVNMLDNGEMKAVTVGRYLTRNRIDIEGQGLTPDIFMESGKGGQCIEAASAWLSKGFYKIYLS